MDFNAPEWAKGIFRIKGETEKSFSLPEAESWMAVNAPPSWESHKVTEVFSTGFHDFPGQKLVEGRIAEGQAGGMGSGEQLVAILPKNVWFRTYYTGRLYGAPGSHYYKWDGTNLSAMTWDERQTVEALAEYIGPVQTSQELLPLSLPPVEDPPELYESQLVNSFMATGAQLSTVAIPVELLQRLMAGCTDMNAVWEATELLPKQ